MDNMIRRGKTPPKKLFEAYPDLSFKEVNEHIKELGYYLEYYGENLSTYKSIIQMLPLRHFYGVPDNPFIEVYSFRSFTKEEWRTKVWKKIREPKKNGVNLENSTKRRIRNKRSKDVGEGE